LRDDCDRSNNKIEELLRDNKNMESKVSQLNIDKKSVKVNWMHYKEKMNIQQLTWIILFQD